MPDAAPRDAQRPPRADARRNRERVLAAARAAFAAEGLSVSLDEIARRAGVGPGTVHRHFPTKDELVRAVIIDRLHDLTTAATDLADSQDPGAAFFAFFDRMAADAGQNLALSAALTDSADVGQTVLEVGGHLTEAIALLLTRAQQAGAVRGDIDPAELHAILAGALAMEQRLAPGSAGRGLSVVTAGLRPPQALTVDREDGN